MAKQAPIAAVDVDFPTPPLKLAKVMTLCNIEVTTQHPYGHE